MDWKLKQPLSFILVGVGGQGTILASDLLAEVGLRLGYDVKKAEIHGMSQRGGSVTSNLRWAEQVFSPIVPKGCADVLIAFEKLEALRFCEYLRPGGLALINDYSILPVTVSSGGASYPDDEFLHSGIGQITMDQHWVNGIAIAEKAGNVKASNIVMIGALGKLLNLPDDVVQDAMNIRIPAKFLEVNKRAYQAGRNAGN